jgi:hypothetical protein
MGAATAVDRLLAQTPIRHPEPGNPGLVLRARLPGRPRRGCGRHQLHPAIHFADLVGLLPVGFRRDQSVRSAYRVDTRLTEVATLSTFYAKPNPASERGEFLELEIRAVLCPGRTEPEIQATEERLLNLSACHNEVAESAD